MSDISPIVSEFATVEQGEAYLRWIEAKVEASLTDNRPAVPHDVAMKRACAIIEAKRGA